MPLTNPAEKTQALQFLLDVSRQAAVTAAVHDKCREYAVELHACLIPQPAPAETKNPVTVADAVAQAQTPAPAAAPSAVDV